MEDKSAAIKKFFSTELTSKELVNYATLKPKQRALLHRDLLFALGLPLDSPVSKQSTVFTRRLKNDPNNLKMTSYVQLFLELEQKVYLVGASSDGKYFIMEYRPFDVFNGQTPSEDAYNLPAGKKYVQSVLTLGNKSKGKGTLISWDGNSGMEEFPFKYPTVTVLGLITEYNYTWKEKAIEFTFTQPVLPTKNNPVRIEWETTEKKRRKVIEIRPAAKSD